MKILLTLIITSIIFFNGCSSSSKISEKTNKSILSNNSSKSISSDHLEINIPSNWKVIEDNDDKLFDIWLINGEENAVIAFIKINLSNELQIANLDDKLELIKDILFRNKVNMNTEIQIIREIGISSKYNNKSIQYLINDKFQNSVIFGNGNTYYECLSYFNKEYPPNDEEIEELISTQESIISNLTIK